MDEPERTDEQSVFGEVQKVISGLMKFDADSRERIYRTVGTFFGFDDQSPGAMPGADRRTSSAGDSREPHFSTREEISPKDFLFQKLPNTDIDRVACLAYYLARYRDTPHFTTTDINKLNTEAAQIKLSNASKTISNAMRRGLLAMATKGAKQLTAQGEKYVEALPNYTDAKSIMSKVKTKRTRRKFDGASMSDTENGKKENG